MQSGSLPCIFRILNLICFTYIGIALWKSYPYFATPYPDCSIYIRIAPRKLTLTSRSLILISSHHTIFSILPDVAAAQLLAAVAAAAGYGGCSWMQRLWRLLLAAAVVGAAAWWMRVAMAEAIGFSAITWREGSHHIGTCWLDFPPKFASR